MGSAPGINGENEEQDMKESGRRDSQSFNVEVVVEDEAGCLLLTIHTSNPPDRVIMATMPQWVMVGTRDTGGGEPPAPKALPTDSLLLPRLR